MGYPGGANNIDIAREAGLFLNVSISQWLVFGVTLIAGIILLIMLIKLARSIIIQNKFDHQDIFLVRLPKEKDEENKGEPNSEEIQEDIAKAETIFSAIAGLRAQRGFKSWLWGRNDHFSLEIVANQKKIAFYVVSPQHLSRYMEQQIHAYYPEASIEQVEDYNIFHSQGEVLASSVRPKRSFIFPIKTYRQIEAADPMNSLVNVMSKLNKDESMALQFTVRSAKPGWHRRINKLVREIHQGKTIQEALKANTANKILAGIGDLFRTASNKEEEKPNSNQMSAMEEEMLKGIEEKNSKGGLDVNFRVVVNAK
ncbi:MAG TPA: hypothetical protein VKO42_05500, partial [Patescibacteria group bacterium]|nr:hypothetical protein [Patescibacteria group bacterium]